MANVCEHLGSKLVFIKPTAVNKIPILWVIIYLYIPAQTLLRKFTRPTIPTWL